MPKAILVSTQDHLPIADIVDEIVVLKDGSAALIIQTSAVNFGLLSEKEQDATIFAYAALLNSLSYPIQILIRSKRSDVSSYLESLAQAYRKQNNPDLKSQIGKYIDFVKATVQKGRVLDKKFYLVISFSFLELGASKALAGWAKRGKDLPFPKDYIVEQAKINLYPKKDQLIKQLTRLGLAGQVLSQPELVELFFDIYNPLAVGAQKVTAEAGTYTGAIIEPAVDAPASKPLPQPSPQPSPISPAGTTTFAQPSSFGSMSEAARLGPSTQTGQTQSPAGEKILKELQEVVNRARLGLAAKTQGPVPAGTGQGSTLGGEPGPTAGEQSPKPTSEGGKI